RTAPGQGVAMSAWFRSLSWPRRILLLVALAVALVHLGIVVQRSTRKIGDFNVNREFGRRFLAGESLYEGGNSFNYMPINALYHAPLALLPVPAGIALRYAAALACLALTLYWLSVMIPGRGRARFTVGVVALVLGFHYLLRDLDDGGP